MFKQIGVGLSSKTSKWFGVQDLCSLEELKQVEGTFKSLLAQATYEEATRKLVPLSHVVEYLSRVGSALRTQIAQIPDRMAPRLAPETDEETVHTLLSREIESITQSIGSSIEEAKIRDNLAEKAVKDPVLKSNKITKAHVGEISK